MSAMSAVRVAAQTLLTQTLGRLALNFHRRKEWTSAAIGASLSPGQAAKPAYSADLILSPPGDVHVDGAHHFPVRRNDDPVCNRIRQRRPFVADVASEEKHEDLE